MLAVEIARRIPSSPAAMNYDDSAQDTVAASRSSRRFVEQQRHQLPRREPEQQRPRQPQQQHRLSRLFPPALPNADTSAAPELGDSRIAEAWVVKS